MGSDEETSAIAPYAIQSTIPQQRFNLDELDPALSPYITFVTGTETTTTTSFKPIRVTATCKEPTSFPICDPGN